MQSLLRCRRTLADVAGHTSTQMADFELCELDLLGEAHPLHLGPGPGHVPPLPGQS
ncbi:hypothetical protein KBY82_10135 [Cyanobium sp. AMD-g]|uniref:hypothetical protein n=1 Tax=Cyanobium sp. AMD-g TaxID=2823699 RepID=UPI0020CD41C1|nr:hypothetical protein [Cyanobium sp. AMD-g]MCP9931144.1 hypothetical protein [Cyanobium sp. AMD-g]